MGPLRPIHRWRFTPMPEPGEILSGFLARTARLHGLDTYGLLALDQPAGPHLARDLDRDPDPAWLTEIARNSGHGADVLRALTLADARDRILAGFGHDTLPPQGDAPLLLSVGVFHRTRRLHGFCACPRCQESRPGLFRREGRLAFAVACSICGSGLVDACQACDAPIIPHRARRAGLCHDCGRPLKDATPSTPREAALGLAQALQAILEGREAAVGPWTGPEVFAGVRTLLAAARHKAVHPRLRQSLGLTSLERDTATARFEHARLSDRELLLETVGTWLAAWSDGFREAGLAAGLTQRSFRRLAPPAALRDELASWPAGHAKKRIFVPVLTAPRLKRLRRRDPAAYRSARTDALLAAAARMNGRRKM